MQKSKVLKSTNTPQWNQEFTFYPTRQNPEIKLQLKDRSLLKDTVVGEVNFNGDQFLDGYKHEQSYTLVRKSGTAGTIYLEVWWSSREQNGLPKPKPVAESVPTPSASKEEKEEKKEKKSAPEPKVTRVEDAYEVGKVLGKGAFSVVKLGTKKRGESAGKQFAVKIINKKEIPPQDLALLQREIDIMQKLKHPHIIKLEEVIEGPNDLNLILEYVKGGELFDAIVKRGSYSEKEAAHIIRQTLEAIAYCHEQGIAHRDLKPENLLLAEPDKKGRDVIKIADFGLSKDTSEGNLVTSCGTPDYVAPEVLTGEAYDNGVDIWSIGVISYILLCGFPPFYGDSQKQLFDSISNCKYDFPDPEWTHISKLAKDFIAKIFVANPEERLTAAECLSHEWISTYTEAAPSGTPTLQPSFSIARFKEYTEGIKKTRGNAEAF